MKILNLNLNRKLIVFFMLVSMIPFATISLISYFDSQEQLYKIQEQQISSTIRDRERALQQIDVLRTQQLAGMATNAVVQVAIEEYNTMENGGKPANKAELEAQIADFKTDMIEFQEATGGDSGFKNLKFVGAKGTIYFASDPTVEGANISSDPNFQKALKGEFRTLDTIDGKRVITTYVPVYGHTTEHGGAMGVIIGESGTDAIDAVLKDRSALGQTGETYLVNYDKIMITESRFVEDSAFNLRVDTAPVKSCIENNRGFVGSYIDERGTNNFGASVCNKEAGYILVGEYDNTEIEAPIKHLQELYLTIGTIIAGVVGAFAWIMGRRITQPIAKTTNTIQQSSQHMMDAVTQINTNIITTSQSVQNIANASQMQAQNVNNINSSLATLNSSIQNLAHKSTTSSELSKQVGELAEKSTASAREAQNRMNKIITVSDESAKKIQTLVDQSNKISSVMSIIQKISDQINLLALNAAVEAARAGEAGRGFAVVAEEVRRLAEDAARSTRDIESLVSQIQQNAQTTATSIKEGTKEITESKDIIEGSLSALNDIAKKIKDVTANVIELADTAQNQVSEIENVSKATSELAVASEETASSTEECSATSEEQTAEVQEISTSVQQMAEVVDQLTKIVGYVQVSKKPKKR